MPSIATRWIAEQKRTEIILKVITALFLFSFGVFYAYASVKFGTGASIAIAIIPSALLYVWFTLHNPRIGIMTLFIYGYFMMGLYRYYNSFPLGGIVDIVIVLTFVAIILKSMIEKFDLSPMGSTVSVLAFIWMLYGILQLANPAAPGMQGWVYAIRGYNLHMWSILVLGMVLLRKEKDVNIFITIWSIFTLLAVFKGIYQYYFGFNAAEWRWLDAGERNTHILASGVRIFSFLSDASQFGASMGQSATVFGILALKSDKRAKQIYFAIVAVLALIGVSLSGTRGALFIPFTGAIMYVILTKKVRVMIIGAALIASVFAIIKFTDIGDKYYSIRRMRSAFNLNDPSFLIRLKHQQMFREYNSGKPFGSGVGSSYHTSSRLYPDTYLSTFATDSWYWAIFAEQGIVGVVLYLLVVLYMLIYGAYICMFKLKDEIVAHKMKAFLCGFAGILVASYANEIVGQFPTNVITYITIGFIFTSERFVKNKQSK